MNEENVEFTRKLMELVNEEMPLQESLQSQVSVETPTVIEFLGELGQLESSSANEMRLLHIYTVWLRNKYEGSKF
jgi:hypothetical protein